MDDDDAREADGDPVPFAVDLPPLLLSVLEHAARRREVTPQQLVRQVLAEWAIGEIRRPRP